jgi:hypothetical protein
VSENDEYTIGEYVTNAKVKAVKVGKDNIDEIRELLGRWRLRKVETDGGSFIQTLLPPSSEWTNVYEGYWIVELGSESYALLHDEDVKAFLDDREHDNSQALTRLRQAQDEAAHVRRCLVEMVDRKALTLERLKDAGDAADSPTKVVLAADKAVLTHILASLKSAEMLIATAARTLRG